MRFREQNESATDEDWSTVNDLLREMLAESHVPQSGKYTTLGIVNCSRIHTLHFACVDHNIQRRKLNTKGFHAMRG